MSKFLNKIAQTFRDNKNVVIIIAAAILVELITAVQYYYAHRMLHEQLDNRAEIELRLKAILIKGLLNVREKTMIEHVWDIHRNISNADSMFDVTKRIIMNSPEMMGSCLAFVPNYYPEKGKLFEPYAYKEGNTIKVKQLAEEGKHDYTHHPAFQRMTKEMTPFWSDPYQYKTDSTVMSLTTFSYPLIDKDSNLIAVCGLDFSLEMMSDTLDAHHTYPSSFNILLTNSGKIISRPPPHHPKVHDIDQVVKLINDKTTKRNFSRSGRSEYITFKSEKDGSKGYVFFANMRGKPNWVITVVCYDKEVYGQLFWMRLKTIFMMLLGFGILGFIIHQFARNERKLHNATIRQELLNGELRIAQNIQMDMLPKVFPPYPERNDIQIYGSLVPAKEVGGDIFDYFLRDEKLFFCIGDVSGKGIPSAIIMAETHSQFRMASVHENNPARIMQTLNIASCEGNESNIFITLFIGVLDLPTGRLRYCNAGHDIPYLISATDTNTLSPLPMQANIPIGLFDEFHYKMQETYIKQGTTLFLYTDGLPEAKNKAHKQFGTNRVEKVLKSIPQASPEEIIRLMDQQVHLFIEDAEQSDDLTMLSIKYTPKHDEFIEKEEITLTNDIKHVKTLNAFVKSITDKLNIDTSQARNIKLAVEEAVVNAMDYAYPKDIEGNITVQVMYNENKMKFVIIDSGVAFDPTEATLADTSLSIEDRPVGGLGLLLVRKMMDSINYERINNQNTLTLITSYTKKQ